MVVVFNSGGASSTDSGEDVNGGCSGASVELVPPAPLRFRPCKDVRELFVEGGKRIGQAMRLR